MEDEYVSFYVIPAQDYIKSSTEGSTELQEHTEEKQSQNNTETTNNDIKEQPSVILCKITFIMVLR